MKKYAVIMKKEEIMKIHEKNMKNYEENMKKIFSSPPDNFPNVTSSGGVEGVLANPGFSPCARHNTST